MAIQTFSIGTNFDTSESKSSLSVIVPAGGVPAGSVIIVTVLEWFTPSYPVSSMGTLADNGATPNTYYPGTPQSPSGSTGNGIANVYYAYNSEALSAGKEITYTYARTGNDCLISAMYATGLKVSTDPLDAAVTALQTGASNTPSIASGAPSVSGDLFIAVLVSSYLYSATITQDSADGWEAPPTAASAHDIFNEYFPYGNIFGGSQVNAGLDALTFSPGVSTSGALDYAAWVLGFQAITETGSAANTIAPFVSAAAGHFVEMGSAANTIAKFASAASASFVETGSAANTIAAFVSVAFETLINGHSAAAIPPFTSNGAGVAFDRAYVAGSLIGQQPTSLQGTIPAYLYQEYSDDDNLQAFVAAYNNFAQQYVDWFNQVGLPVYTGALIAGPLLDWVAQGLYGMTRPVLPAARLSLVGAFNSFAFNTTPYNGRRVLAQIYYTVDDDIFKRCMTWRLYRGDGKIFSVTWLKRRIMRFLNGPNGTDPGVNQTYPIWVSVGPDGEFYIRVFQGVRTITGGALPGTFEANTTEPGSTLTAFEPLGSTAAAQALVGGITSGTLELPFQYTFNISVAA